MTHLRWKLSGDATPQLAMLGRVRREVGKGEYRGLEFLEVDAKTIITKTPGGPRYGFGYSINAYRGCSHACTYCFARPTHEYLGLDGWGDFDSRIVVKTNAVALARHEMAPARWAGHLIAMGTNTDPYQPAEGKYRLTRGILEVMSDYGNPTSILTKSPLVLRDIDVLAELGERTEVRVDFSVGTLDEEVWKATEPGTPHPRRRIDAVRRLRDAGIRSGVLMGPILPGLSDAPEQIAAVVDAAADAGAVSIGGIPLHLRGMVAEHYYARLAHHRPDLINRYRRHFAGRGEAPAEYSERIIATVRNLRAGRFAESPPEEAATPPPPVSAQLSLEV